MAHSHRFRLHLRYKLANLCRCSVSSVRPRGKSGSTCCRPFRGEGPIDLSSHADPEVRTLEGCVGVRAQGRLCPAGDLAVNPGLLAVPRGNARALLRCLAWYAALLGPGSPVPESGTTAQ